MVTAKARERCRAGGGYGEFPFMILENISVIIPTLNEEEHIKRCIETVLHTPGIIEVIIADGGSTDSTIQIARGYRDVKVVFSMRGRSVQMNRGAFYSHGDILLFLHADCILPGEIVSAIRHVFESSQAAGGAFTMKLLSDKFIYRMIEMGINFRSRIFKLPYGDQGLFVKRSLFKELGGFKKMTVCEDLDFVWRLKKYGRITILDNEILTSVRRWRKNGFLRTSVRNQLLLTSYFLGRRY
ncbi:MAG: TIGR04283 family arsenosugar biosynthesis glycosyltransferase [Candidatus Scalindua sp.]|nr:TIGR04283 family arsenosugar biosynthesis glycosyltransferase [Candidatus Scalindua sp.]